MARNRKRAKQRKRRQGSTHHANSPGALEHASGEVEEFDAALIAGADGREASPNTGGGLEHPEELSTEDFAELEDRLDQIEATMESGDRQKVEQEEERLEAEVSDMQPTTVPKQGLIGRTIGFLRSSWAELQRVQWPDRRQVGQATAVVLGFVIIAGVYLGVADVAAQKLVNLII